ncbi:MAG: restriction endonuclease [Chloroflexi bacterium]|nr:restriction endonuclease [Chloroflexota bacterium]
MSIWVYGDVARDPAAVLTGSMRCTFCSTDLTLFHRESGPLSFVKGNASEESRVYVCPTCGWWRAAGWQEFNDIVHRLEVRTSWHAAASLRELDVSRDLSLPIGEVRSLLAARYDKRYDLHPKLFEDVVGSVFKDHGFEPEVTAYSNDGGLDVILRARDQTSIGVQVKRYKERIQLDQIRSLAGVLFRDGLTRGMFVTTSDFTSGAAPEAERFRTRGIAIELVDAKRFYEALRIAQVEMYKDFADFPVQECLSRLVKIEEQEVWQTRSPSDWLR